MSIAKLRLFFAENYHTFSHHKALIFKHFTTRAHSVSPFSVPYNTCVALTNITPDAYDCVCTISQLQLLHGSVLDMVLRFENPGFFDIATYRRQLEWVVP